MDGIAQDVAPIASAVRLAADGDRVAFARIVEAYHADMVRVAFIVAGCDQETAADATQSAWAIAWRKLGTLHDPERLRPWLLAVAANEARQILRHRRRHPVTEIAVDAPDPATPDPAALVSVLDVRRAVARLAPDDRALLALRYIAGLDAAEIGAATGSSASSVRGRRARLLARLREELVDA